MKVDEAFWLELLDQGISITDVGTALQIVEWSKIKESELKVYASEFLQCNDRSTGR